jgi:signal transduction histidine kinase
VLEGHLTIHVDRGAGMHKVAEWRAGDVSGILPFSRMHGASFGDIVAEEETMVFTVGREHNPEKIRECYELTAVLVHVMVDRARLFNSSDLRDEKLISLGKLSAGLAHELNNPASAIARSAKTLSARLAEAEKASRALGAAKLTPAQLDAVDSVRAVCMGTQVTSVRSPLESSDHEEAMAEWLVSHGASDEAAAPLAETGIAIETLDGLAVKLDGGTLDVAVRWIAAGCATRSLAGEIEMAATRIHDLVGAVKGFTRMDQGSVPEAVNIRTGLGETLAVLAGKARSKELRVTLQAGDDLPMVYGYAVELNQVWANLIDNAFDAAPHGGNVEISATASDGRVKVSVTDNGPGIPHKVRAHIFDPFFTTKPVGQGTGLGLDIVRRLVQQHQGEIDVRSAPGRTEFLVTLPGLQKKN